MKNREMGLLLILILLNLAVVTFPLSFRNDRLQQENRRLRSRFEQGVRPEKDSGNDYGTIDEIRNLARSSGLAASSEEVLFEGRIRYSLRFSEVNAEKMAAFFSGLSELSKSVGIIDLHLPLQGAGETELTLEIEGGRDE